MDTYSGYDCFTNNGVVVVGFIIDLKKDYTPYFKAFIKAIGLKDGDECKNYEFINWITGKHEEFRKSIGLDKYTPYTKEQEKMFLKFINGSRCNP